MKQPFFFAAVLTLCLPALAQATTLNVPAQYATIQAGVNAAANGDTVLIADGTYTGDGNRDIDFNGKSLTVTSQNGAAATIIDCQGSNSANSRGFHIHKNELYAVIRGLTIENAVEGSNSTFNGGAIASYNVSITIQDCIIKNSTALDGGGIWIQNADGACTVSNCTVIGNTCTDAFGGAGLNLSNDGMGTITVTNCSIRDNTSSGGSGGGISNTNFAGGTISVINCTFSNNAATHGGGLSSIYGPNSGSMPVTNCTFTGNTAKYDGGAVWNDRFADNTTSVSPILFTNDILYNDIYLSGDSSGREAVNNPNSTAYATFSHCDIQGGYAGTGNINADPKLVSTTDFHLQPASPCLGAGTSTGAPATDKDGIVRPNPPSIGAYDIAGSTPPATPPTNILWDNTSGATSIWNENATDDSYTHNEYGPYLGYTATAIADGGTDGKTRVLWNKTDGSASIWSLDSSAGQFAHFEFGPFPGYTAAALSVAADNTTHVLWDNANGLVSIWNYSTLSGTYSHHEYGPYPGWTAKAIADGPDGKTRLLWSNRDGRMSLWSLDNTAGTFTQNTFGPFAGWTAGSVSVAADNTTHVLWDNTSGAASVWNENAVSGSYSHREYGPYAGWTAKAVADGADGRVRMQWDNTSGQMSLWSLDNTTGVYSQFTYGAFAGWTATSVSAF